MAVFHTAGLPPRRGRIILATIGCTMNTSAAPTKLAAENSHTRPRRDAGRSSSPRSGMSPAGSSRGITAWWDRLDSTSRIPAMVGASGRYGNARIDEVPGIR